jgi:general stress protein YciG
MRGKGFASMTPERLREVSSRGGKNVPKEKRAFNDLELATTAGKRGGKRLAIRENKRAAISAALINSEDET